MLQIYNSLSRQKEYFRPLHEGRVGMYVCGPTVYGDAHLGHARPAITFDLLFRYLQYLAVAMNGRLRRVSDPDTLTTLLKREMVREEEDSAVFGMLRKKRKKDEGKAAE